LEDFFKYLFYFYRTTLHCRYHIGEEARLPHSHSRKSSFLTRVQTQ